MASEQIAVRKSLWRLAVGLVVLLLVVALVEAAVLAAVLWASPESRSMVVSCWRSIWPRSQQTEAIACKDPMPGDRALFLDEDVRRMHRHIDRMFEEVMGRMERQMQGFVYGSSPLASGISHPAGLADHVRYLQRDIDRLFREALQEQSRLALARGFSQASRSGPGVSPAMDLRDGGDHYMVLVNLPGMAGSNLQVSIEGRLLSIRADPEAFGDDGLPRRRFETRLMLPGPVDADSIRAAFEDGVLHVRAPKAKAESKKIVVKTGTDS